MFDKHLTDLKKMLHTVHTYQIPFLNEEHTSVCVLINERLPIEALS